MTKSFPVKWAAAVLVLGMALSGCTIGGASGSASADSSALTDSTADAESPDSSDNSGSSAATGSSTDGIAEYASVFEKDSVIDINIDVKEADWAAILADATAEQYYSADVTVDGTKVSNVGIRAKGNSSLMSVAGSDSDRYSLRVKFDKYVDNQNLLGLDELVLNNCFNDPSYMREYLTYEAFRELGADVPLTVYANIYINGELFGFYLCVEDVNDSFLNREFGNNDGNLYKAGEGSTLSSDSSLDTFSLKNGDDEDLSDLQNVVDVLAAMPDGEKGDIESVLDVDSALKYMAVNTVLGSYDSYLGDKAQNFYFCENNGVFTVIPWDHNMSFGGYTNDSGASTTITIDEPLLGVTMESRPLVSKLLAVDEYLQKYHEYIAALNTYLGGLDGRIEELAAIIRPYVAADPNSFYTTAEFEDAIILHDDSDTAAGTATPAATDTAAGDTTVTPAGSSAATANSNNSQTAVPSGMGAPPGGNTGVAPDGYTGNMPGGGQGGPGGNMGSNPDGGQGGGMPVNSIPVSILDYAADRMQNITRQLAGDLPTTGNTTAANSQLMPGTGKDSAAAN